MTCLWCALHQPTRSQKSKLCSRLLLQTGVPMTSAHCPGLTTHSDRDVPACRLLLGDTLHLLCVSICNCISDKLWLEGKGKSVSWRTGMGVGDWWTTVSGALSRADNISTPTLSLTDPLVKSQSYHRYWHHVATTTNSNPLPCNHH